MFSKEWFIKHQRILLWLVNTPVIRTWFRYLLRINGDKSSVGSRKVARILPNSILWIEKQTKRKVTVSEEFRTHDKFSKRLYYGLLPLWYVLHAWDMLFANNFQPSWNLGFDTTGNLYPAAGANSPVDGSVSRDGVDDANFATIRNGAGNAANVTTTGNSTYIGTNGTTNHFSANSRWIFCFTTSTIGAGKQVDAVVISTYPRTPNEKANAFGGTFNLHFAGANIASTANLANADYQACAFTSFGSIAYAAYTGGQYNDCTLNAAGKTNINMTGVSQFSGQHSWDIAGSFDGSWVINDAAYFWAYHADQTGTNNDPKLVVTYSTALTSGGAFLLNFV